MTASPRVPSRAAGVRRKGNALLRRLRRWRKRARWAQRKLKALSRPVRIGGAVVALLAVLTVVNFAYQVASKPTELFFPISGAFNKTPADTWEQYGSLFQEYSTSAAPPELLAALAQIEGAGNPVARTYWRWRFTWHPFAIYEPASSAVGMYQMTDPAFAEARRYCIRDHVVVEEGCWLAGLYTRIVPSHAIELTAAYLDRKVETILAVRPDLTASPQQKQDLAAIIHLCGAGPARGFARRGFHLLAEERCGDHDPAKYLADVNAMARRFRRLAAAR